jgi:hypothetical protein
MSKYEQRLQKAIKASVLFGGATAAAALPFAFSVTPQIAGILDTIAFTGFVGVSTPSIVAIMLEDDIKKIPPKLKNAIRKLSSKEKETLYKGIAKIKGKIHERKLREVI